MEQPIISDDRDPSTNGIIIKTSVRTLSDVMRMLRYSRKESTGFQASKLKEMLSEYVSNWYTPDTSKLKLYLQAVSADERFELLKKLYVLGYTAVHVAVLKGDTAVMRCLLEMVEPQKRYELLKIQDRFGETPLDVAARRGRTEVMKCMLELVEPKNQIQLLDIPNEYNKTALDVAKGKDTVQLIRQYRESAVREITDKTSPREYLSYVRNDLSLEERESLMSDERLRSKTFLVNWPHDGNLSGVKMAQAGFYCVDDYRIPSVIPSYNREIACYPIARYPDNQNPLMPLSLQKKLAEMSPREYLSAVLRELSLEERELLMSDEKQRRKTFLVNWSHDSNLSGVKMAQAGFYCVDDYDRVQCVFCRGSLHKWKAEDNPMTEHAKLFPFCRFVKGLECGNKEYKSDRLLAEMKKNRDGSVSTNSNAFGISTTKGAVIKYAPYETRKNTYGRWPAADVIRPEPLCEAGFYYTGFDDHVRCFFCSGEWRSEDNPWEEHARWFPGCPYVLQHKGEIYVTEVRARTEDGKKCPLKTVLQKKTEKEWKQKGLTQQAMYELIVTELNHDRRAVDIAINRNGKTFDSVKEMLEAVYQVEEDGNIDSDRMETTCLVPDNLKWIFNPSLYGISSAVPSPPSYLTDVLCYAGGHFPDTRNPLSMDLLQKLDKMSPKDYCAAIRNDLSTIQLHWLMSMEMQRRKTFHFNWPHAGSLSGERMAQAGFYHSGGHDSVRCVFCGVVFEEWNVGDNPITEHKKFVPSCWFIQSLKSGIMGCPTDEPTETLSQPTGDDIP